MIIKVIHKWLLLQDCYYIKSLSADQLCPSCQGAMETAQHFLVCPHTNCQKIWKELHEALQKHAIHHNFFLLSECTRDAKVLPLFPLIKAHKLSHNSTMTNCNWDGNNSSMVNTSPYGVPAA